MPDLTFQKNDVISISINLINNFGFIDFETFKWNKKINIIEDFNYDSEITKMNIEGVSCECSGLKLSPCEGFTLKNGKCEEHECWCTIPREWTTFQQVAKRLSNIRVTLTI